MAALAALPDLAARGGRPYRPALESRVIEEIAGVKRAGARYLFHDLPDYPALLARIDSAPPILTIRGDAALASRPAVAVVGARNASAAAVKLARDFAAGLAEAGLVVVSGLARGIDGAAHRGALSVGSTIGVIASGIDVAYPPEHAELQDEVATRGLLVAEQPIGTEPLARHFPSRNRIIAGLAAGTLVVEAAPKSGSLITARLAAEQGKEVFAIPGSIHSPQSRGCHALIKQGAKLVELAQDVLEELNLSTTAALAAGTDDAEAPEADDPLIAALGFDPVSLDALQARTGLDTPRLQASLLELELCGQVVRLPGGLFQRLAAG